MAKTNFTGSRPPAPLLSWAIPAIGGWMGGLAVGRRRSRRDELCSRLREVGAREQGVGAMVKHDAAEVPDEGKGLSMQVSEHGVRTPAAHQANGVGVDAAAKESHGAAGPEATGIDIGGGEAQCEEGAGSRTE